MDPRTTKLLIRLGILILVVGLPWLLRLLLGRWKYGPLLLGGLLRKKIRTTLTILSIMVAMFLFGLLAVIDTAFTAGLDVAGADRLVVIGRNGVIQPLPMRYEEQIARIPGVTDVASASWFGGVYQDERNFFAQFAVEDEAYLRIYPEYVVPEDQMKAYLADRQGCIVGRKTAERFGWKIGDRIPLKGSIFPGTWEFNVRGIYSGRRQQDDETSFMLRAKYLEERAPRFWKGLVGWYVVQVKDPGQSEAIARQIDERFSNSSAETKTQREEAFIASWINQMGNIRLLVISVGIVVFFTLLLVTGNTMAIAVRERTGEWAVLKTVGFGDRTVLALVLVESLTIASVGGGLGLLLARAFTSVGSPMPGLLPVFYLPTPRLVAGILLTLFVGLAAGLIPGVLAMRLRIVDALRRV
jgi:putative ABC transport system permease protein